MSSAYRRVRLSAAGSASVAEAEGEKSVAVSSTVPSVFQPRGVDSVCRLLPSPVSIVAELVESEIGQHLSCRPLRIKLLCLP